MARRSNYHRYAYNADNSQYRRVSNGLSGPGLVNTAVDSEPVQRAVSVLSRSLNNTLDNAVSLLQNVEKEKEEKDAVLRKAKKDTFLSEEFAKIGNETDVDTFKQNAVAISEKMMEDATPDETSTFKTLFEARYRNGVARVVENDAVLKKQQEATDYAELQKRSSENAALAIRNGDKETAAKLNKQAVIYEDLMTAKGFLSPIQRASLVDDRQYNAELAGHYGALDKLKKSGFSEMMNYVRAVNEDNAVPTEKRLKFVAALQDECMRYRSQNAVGKTKRDENRDAFVRSIEKGFNVNETDIDAAQAEATAAGDSDNYNDLETARRISKITNYVRQMPPEEMDAIIDAAVVHPETALFDEKLNISLRKLRENTVADLQSDPMNVPVRAGLVSPLFDFTPESLQRRVEEKQIADIRYRRRFPVFTKEEKENVAKMITSFDLLEDQARVLGTVMTSIGQDNSAELIEAVAPKNPEIAHAAYIANTGDEETAAAILNGAKVRSMNPEYEAKKNEELYASLSKMLPSFLRESKPEYERGLKLAVMDYYADKARAGGDTSNAVNEDLLKEAVDRITGGVVEYSAGKTIVPFRGMDNDQFEDFIDGLRASDFAGAMFDNLTIGNAEFIRENAEFVAIGPNRYRVRINGRGLMQSDGRTEFVFSFKPYLHDALVRDEKLPDGEGDFSVAAEAEDWSFYNNAPAVVFVPKNGGDPQTVAVFASEDSAVAYAADCSARQTLLMKQPFSLAKK